MPHEFCGPCGFTHTTLVDAACVRQLPNLRWSTRSKKPLDKAEGFGSVKTEVESSTETLEVPVDTESRVSDDEQAPLDKLKRLEKQKRKIALERKAKLLEEEI